MKLKPRKARCDPLQHVQIFQHTQKQNFVVVNMKWCNKNIILKGKAIYKV
jgi:hypothetical protein